MGELLPGQHEGRYRLEPDWWSRDPRNESVSLFYAERTGGTLASTNWTPAAGWSSSYTGSTQVAAGVSPSVTRNLVNNQTGVYYTEQASNLIANSG